MIKKSHLNMQKTYKIIYNLKLKYNCNIVFDTRLIKENDIFIGIKTKNKNGSLYYKEAIKKKASLIIVNKKINQDNCIYVKDTDLFIKNFCKFIIKTYKGKIIAITGSVGKTTFKENIYYILKNNNFRAYRSFKNYNNILGVQFSIMNINTNADYSVFELGINGPNEMTKLVKILKPHYSLITCIENSHIGNFRNFKHLIDNKLKIFNSDRLIHGIINFNHDSNYIKGKINSKVKLINVENIKKKFNRSQKKINLSFYENKRYYKINSFNESIYANIGIVSFLFLKKFIKKFKIKTFFYKESIIESRGNEITTFINNKKVKFFDHSYNASPYSLNKQILIFNKRNINQKVYILGSMKELGEYSDLYHFQIIDLVSNLNLNKIIFIGNEFYKFKKRFSKFNFYKNYTPVISYLSKEIDGIKNIFVMGSRFYQLDRIIKKYVS